MAERQVVRLYEDSSFELTPEQIAKISPVLEEVADGAKAGDPGCVLAQIWHTEDGIFAQCHAISASKGAIIKDVIHAETIQAIRVERPAAAEAENPAEMEPGWEPYRPSNGSEGEIFMGDFCDRCTKAADCSILMRTQIFDRLEEGYPLEWRRKIGDRSWPGSAKCTAFEKASGA